MTDRDLERLGRAVNKIQDLEDEITLTVARLRARFVSWADIADELGVSKQAAQQRYGEAVK